MHGLRFSHIVAVLTLTILFCGVLEAQTLEPPSGAPVSVSPGPPAPSPTESVVLKRYEFFVAVLTLAGTLVLSSISLYQQYQQRRRLDVLAMTVRNTDEIRLALQKPLEGEWDFAINYDKFHDKIEPHSATGKAVFIWKPSSHTYQIYLGSSVSKDGSPGDYLVTAFMSGSLDADHSGWPPQDARMLMKYIGRTGKPGFETFLKATFEYEDCKCQETQDGTRAHKIDAIFKGKNTEAKVIFTRSI